MQASCWRARIKQAAECCELQRIERLGLLTMAAPTDRPRRVGGERGDVRAWRAEAAAEAWAFGKDSWHSYLVVINEAIVPKVGEPFVPIS